MAAMRGRFGEPWVSCRAGKVTHKKRKGGEMPVSDFAAIQEAAGWVTAAVLGGFVGIKKLMRFTAASDASIEHARADESLVKGLRTELERLSGQNGRLADALNLLQNDVTDLLKQVGRLKAENDRQAHEIIDLRGDNGRLRKQIAALHREIDELRALSGTHTDEHPKA
jgi:septal ring factor EnvC (AmiA/AmiB activator)